MEARIGTGTEFDPITIIAAWVEALNAGNMDDALSYVADDAVVTIVPPSPGTSGVFAGQAEIRAWYEAMGGQHGVTTLSDCRVDGETVTCVDTYAEDSLRSIGLDSVAAEWVAIVREGKLQSYTFAMTDESLKEMTAAMSRLG